jgi:hypothetical protein
MAISIGRRHLKMLIPPREKSAKISALSAKLPLTFADFSRGVHDPRQKASNNHV